MKRFNSKLLIYSSLICVLVTVLIPSRYIDEGVGKYVYGFPFTNVTIYQLEPYSKWFWINFIAGNDGISINPLSILLNIGFFTLF